MQLKNELTVVIPVSRIEWLKDCIDSVLLSITHSNQKSELVLIDVRENNTPPLINQLNITNHKIKIIELPGADYGRALKESKKYIASTYVALMNDDDLVTKERFLLQHTLISKLKADICIGKMKRFGDFKFSMNLQPSKKYSHEMLYLGPYGANATWYMTSKFFQDLPEISNENWDWNTALMKFHGSKLAYLPLTIYLYRQHAGQATRKLGYREQLFTSISKQWKESFQAQFGLEASNITIKAVALPYLKFRISKKDFQQILSVLILLRRTFRIAPVWTTYQFTARLISITLGLLINRR
jgi:hypothetical protein